MARTYVYRPAAHIATDASNCPPSTPAPRHRPARGGVAVLCHPDATVVTKRIKPGRPGTKGALQQHGDALVCVRYRDDRERGHRYTTVELVIDQRPIRPQPLVRVHIAFDGRGHAPRRASHGRGMGPQGQDMAHAPRRSHPNGAAAQPPPAWTKSVAPKRKSADASPAAVALTYPYLALAWPAMDLLAISGQLRDA